MDQYECTECGYVVPSTSPNVAEEFTAHMRSAHPRDTDPKELTEDLDIWLRSARQALRGFSINRSPARALGVASRLHTAIRLLDTLRREMEVADQRHNNFRGYLNGNSLRDKFHQQLDGR